MRARDATNALGLAEIRARLAPALWERGDDRGAALALAREAEAVMAEKDGDPDLLASLRAWIRTHGNHSTRP